MRELELKNVYNKCLVDDDDFERFKNIKLSVNKDNHVYYTKNGTRYIHREILNVKDRKLVVDHIDGNPLNNQKSNLRLCERFQNSKNLKINSKNITGFKGITFSKESRKWKAVIVVDGKNIYLGSFKNKMSAVETYDRASKKYHKEFGATNLELKQREQIILLYKPKQPTKYDDIDLKPGMIPLGNKKYAYVDVEDFERVMKYSWSYSHRYAATNIRNGKDNIRFSLHRFLMNPADGFVVDHIDGDGLNNRKLNLRVCTAQQNRLNSKNFNSKNRTSKYKGVRFRKYKKSKRFEVHIAGKYLGAFDTEEQAALFYDSQAREKLGQFASLNFK